jgi:hypothetical protein
MKIRGTLKVVLVAKMKLPVVCVLISLGFVSQALAVSRPLFPVKPAPPYNGEVIIIGRFGADLKKNAAHSGTNDHNQMKEQLTQASTRYPTQGEVLFAHIQSRPMLLRRL